MLVLLFSCAVICFSLFCSGCSLFYMFIMEDGYQEWNDGVLKNKTRKKKNNKQEEELRFGDLSDNQSMMMIIFDKLNFHCS